MTFMELTFPGPMILGMYEISYEGSGKVLTFFQKMSSHPGLSGCLC